jgi:hypothetical protein
VQPDEYLPSRIASRIVLIRAQRLILGPDLAALYGVETRILIQAVRRNALRFPGDFVFSLTKQELMDLRSQIVISSWGGARWAPLAFTEHGAIMAATLLKTRRAAEVSVFVVRAFVQMREGLARHREVGKRLDELERRVGTHDHTVAQILSALRQLTQPPDAPRRRRIGFV